MHMFSHMSTVVPEALDHSKELLKEGPPEQLGATVAGKNSPVGSSLTPEVRGHLTFDQLGRKEK